MVFSAGPHPQRVCLASIRISVGLTVSNRLFIGLFIIDADAFACVEEQAPWCDGRAGTRAVIDHAITCMVLPVSWIVIRPLRVSVHVKAALK